MCQWKDCKVLCQAALCCEFQIFQLSILHPSDGWLCATVSDRFRLVKSTFQGHVVEVSQWHIAISWVIGVVSGKHCTKPTDWSNQAWLAVARWWRSFTCLLLATTAAIVQQATQRTWTSWGHLCKCCPLGTLEWKWSAHWFLNVFTKSNNCCFYGTW